MNAVSRVRCSRDGAVVYVPPAPGDAMETFLERAAREYRQRGPRATLRGGFTVDELRRAEAEGQPFELSRRRSGVRVLGIRLGGVK